MTLKGSSCRKSACGRFSLASELPTSIRTELILLSNTSGPGNAGLQPGSWRASAAGLEPSVPREFRFQPFDRLRASSEAHEGTLDLSNLAIGLIHSSQPKG